MAGQAVWDLVARSQPDESVPRIVLAALSLLVMPVFAVAKRRLGRRMSSRTVVADCDQTMLCSNLSAVLLLGLVANARLGWWWADPIAAFVIAGLADMATSFSPVCSTWAPRLPCLPTVVRHRPAANSLRFRGRPLCPRGAVRRSDDPVLLVAGLERIPAANA